MKLIASFTLAKEAAEYLGQLRINLLEAFRIRVAVSLRMPDAIDSNVWRLF